jgi:hypothetical protein
MEIKVDAKIEERKQEILATRAIEQKKEDSASSYYDSEYESEKEVDR